MIMESLNVGSIIIITTFFLIVIVLKTLKNKGFRTIEECNKFLFNCKNEQKYMQVLNERAYLYEEQENYSAAIEDCIKVVEYYSQSKDKSMMDELYGRIIFCYEELKKYEQVIFWCTKMINDSAIKVYEDTYYSRAIAYKELGEEEKAQADFKKAIELLTQNIENSLKNVGYGCTADYYLTRSKCYSNLGMYDYAWEDIESAIKYYPELFNEEKAEIREYVLKIFEQLSNIQLYANKLDKYISRKNEILEKLKQLRGV